MDETYSKCFSDLQAFTSSTHKHLEFGKLAGSFPRGFP